MRTLRHRRGPRRQLDRLLRRVQQRSATTVPKRVVGRGRDGVEFHLRLDGNCPTRATIDSHATGQVTLQPAQALSSRGVVGLGQGLEIFAGAVRVDRQEPRELVRGTTQEVTIFGRGFRSSQTWQYLLPPTLEEAELPNPSIEVEEAEFIDSSEARLTVAVAADAALYGSAPIAFDPGGKRPGPPDRPTVLTGRAEDFYAVTQATAAFFAYWATFAGEAVWLAAELDAEGAVSRWLGFLERQVDLDSRLQISRAAPILEDPEGRVGAGSLLQPFSDQLYCHDFENGVIHVAEWFEESVAGAAAWQGEVYAVVHETRTAGVTSRCRLIRLPPDLSSEATVQRIDLDVGGTEMEWFDALGVAIGSSSAWVAVDWTDLATFNFGYQTCVLPFADDEPPSQAPLPRGEAAGPTSLGLPYEPGGAVRGPWLWQGGLGGETETGAWRRFVSPGRGEEGGPGLGEGLLLWDGSIARIGDLANPGQRTLSIPAAVHPDLGLVGPPTLVFPAS
ncbi:MAG: hypothetical protein AAF725_19180 [Acidobacteriota bacterium]